MLAEDIMAELYADLPAVTLLTGQRHAVLEDMARNLMLGHKLLLTDLRYVPRVTAEAARMIMAEADVAPSGDFLGFVISLDGITSQAQKILLKVLEEPPGTSRFILFASEQDFDAALESRCRVYRVHDSGPDPAVDENARAAAAAAVRAAATRDPAALADVLRAWGEKCPCRSGPPHDKGEHYLPALNAWAASQAARYREFYTGPVLDPPAQARVARMVLKVLSDYPRARAQNAAAAALSLAFLES